MSQYFAATTLDRDFSNSHPFDAHHDIDHQEPRYASHNMAYNAAKYEPAIGVYLPIIEHNHALLPGQVAQTNENLPLAQAVYSAAPHYPYQINPRDVAAFNLCYPGGLDSAAGFNDDSVNMRHGENDLGLNAHLPSVYPSNSIHGYDQTMVPTMNWNQPMPAFHSTPAPAGFTDPAPATTSNVAGIRCPEGCPETFGRNEEMRRHMKKHGTPRFKCPIYDCPMTFYRKDKLQDHAKKGHRGRNVIKIC